MKKIFLLCFISMFMNQVASSQEEWSLNKCIQYAIENSYDIYQSNIDMRRSAINTDQSEKQRMPSVSAGTNANWNFGRSIDPTSNEFITTTFFSNGYSINSGISLYEGGRIKNGIKRSKALENVSAAGRDATINLLTINTVSSFFEVLFAQDNLQNVSVQLKSINDQIEQMNKLVNAGSRAKFELYDLEAQLATSEQDQTIAQNRIDLAYLNLKALLNLPSDFDMTLKKPNFEQGVYTNLDLISLEEAYEKAVDFQPLSRQLDYQIEAAAIGIDVAKSAYHPTIGFGGSLATNFSNQGKEVTGFTQETRNTDVLINSLPAVISTEQSSPILNNSPYGNQIGDNFGYGFGFNVSIPIYSRGATKANVDRARLDLENLQTEKSKTNVNLKNDLMQLITDARASKRSLEASEKTLKAREIAYDNAEKRYSLGAINSYEYISIQDQVNTAKTNFLLSKYDYILKVKLLDYFQGYPVGLD